MLLKTIFIVFGGYALLSLIIAAVVHSREVQAREADNAADELNARENERRAELTEKLIAVYKKAKKEGRRSTDFYLLALCQCIQILQSGGEINEGVAALALRGLEGDAELDALVFPDPEKKKGWGLH